MGTSVDYARILVHIVRKIFCYAKLGGSHCRTETCPDATTAWWTLHGISYSEDYLDDNLLFGTVIQPPVCAAVSVEEETGCTPQLLSPSQSNSEPRHPTDRKSEVQNLRGQDSGLKCAHGQLDLILQVLLVAGPVAVLLALLFRGIRGGGRVIQASRQTNCTTQCLPLVELHQPLVPNRLSMEGSRVQEEKAKDLSDISEGDATGTENRTEMLSQAVLPLEEVPVPPESEGVAGNEAVGENAMPGVDECKSVVQLEDCKVLSPPPTEGVEVLDGAYRLGENTAEGGGHLMHVGAVSAGGIKSSPAEVSQLPAAMPEGGVHLWLNPIALEEHDEASLTVPPQCPKQGTGIAGEGVRWGRDRRLAQDDKKVSGPTTEDTPMTLPPSPSTSKLAKEVGGVEMEKEALSETLLASTPVSPYTISTTMVPALAAGATAQAWEGEGHQRRVRDVGCKVAPFSVKAKVTVDWEGQENNTMGAGGSMPPNSSLLKTPAQAVTEASLVWAPGWMREARGWRWGEDEETDTWVLGLDVQSLMSAQTPAWEATTNSPTTACMGNAVDVDVLDYSSQKTKHMISPSMCREITSDHGLPGYNVVILEAGSYRLRCGVLDSTVGGMGYKIAAQGPVSDSGVVFAVCSGTGAKVDSYFKDFPGCVARSNRVDMDPEELVRGASRLDSMYNKFRNTGLFLGRDAQYCVMDHPDHLLRSSLVLSCPMEKSKVTAGDSEDESLDLLSDHVYSLHNSTHPTHLDMMTTSHHQALDMELLWRYAYNLLGQDPSKSPTILAHKPTATKEELQQIMGTFFHIHKVPSLRLVNEATLGAVAAQMTTGILVDIGESGTYVTPIFAGCPLTEESRKGVVGGRHMTKYLAYMLESQLNVHFHNMSEYRRLEYVRVMKEAFCYVSPNFDSETRKAGKFKHKRVQMLGELKGFTKLSNYNICTSREGYGEGDSDNFVTASFTTKAGNEMNIKLGCERFHTAELLFQPDLWAETKDLPSIATVVADAVVCLPPDIRFDLLKDVVLVGGSTGMAGLVQRMQHEVERKVPHHLRAAVQVRTLGVDVLNHSNPRSRSSPSAVLKGAEILYKTNRFFNKDLVLLKDWEADVNFRKKGYHLI